MKLPIQAQPVSRDSLGKTYLGFKAGINPSQPVGAPGAPMLGPVPAPPVPIPPLVLNPPPIITGRCAACIAAQRAAGATVALATNHCQVVGACP